MFSFSNLNKNYSNGAACEIGTEHGGIVVGIEFQVTLKAQLQDMVPWYARWGCQKDIGTVNGKTLHT